jgi:hypothetical protein
VGAFLSRHRLTIMRVLAVLAGLFFIGTFQQAISPWGAVTLSNMEGVHNPSLHRWSAALAGGPDLGAAGILLYLAWRPLRAPLVLQWLATIVVVFLAVNVPFVGPSVALIAVPILLVLVAYPEPRGLLKAPWSEGVSLPLLALGVLVAVFLLPDAARALAAQVRGADELAANADWASNGEHLINLTLAALLAGMRRPGSGALALMVGAVLAFMGLAALAVPTNPGSWGTLGGTAAIAGGIAFLAAAAYEWRRSEIRPRGQVAG